MLMIILSVVIILVVLLFTFLFFFPVVQICGYSMFPTLMDGEFYLGRRVFRKDKCKFGEIYVFRPPYDDREERYIIKRLSGIKCEGDKVQYYFLGDNSNDSYDSRYYGYVDSSNVVAHIVLKKRGVR